MITAGYIPEKGDAALKSKILAALAGILVLAGGYTVWAETYGPYCYGPGAYSSEVQSSQDQSIGTQDFRTSPSKVVASLKG